MLRGHRRRHSAGFSRTLERSGAKCERHVNRQRFEDDFDLDRGGGGLCHVSRSALLRVLTAYTAVHIRRATRVPRRRRSKRVVGTVALSAGTGGRRARLACVPVLRVRFFTRRSTAARKRPGRPLFVCKTETVLRRTGVETGSSVVLERLEPFVVRIVGVPRRPVARDHGRVQRRYPFGRPGRHHPAERPAEFRRFPGRPEHYVAFGYLGL